MFHGVRGFACNKIALSLLLKDVVWNFYATVFLVTHHVSNLVLAILKSIGIGEDECQDHYNWEGSYVSLDFNPWRAFLRWFLLRKPGTPLEYSECHVERTHGYLGMYILVTVMLLGNKAFYGCGNLTGRDLKGTLGILDLGLI